MSKKIRQILAWIAILALVGLYVATLIFSLIGSPFAQRMFQASLIGTFVIPIMIWLCMMALKWSEDSSVIIDLDDEENPEK
ncbi:MAG: hypothetical protein ACI4D7_11165 [Lachnospiraceae bacterium]